MPRNRAGATTTKALSKVARSDQPFSPSAAPRRTKKAGDSEGCPPHPHSAPVQAAVAAGVAFPSQAEIAERLGVARQTVQTWLDMPNAEDGKAHKTDNRVKVVGDVAAAGEFSARWPLLVGSLLVVRWRAAGGGHPVGME